MNQDKLLHAFAGLMIVFVFSGFGLFSAFILACIAGVLKELYDHFHPETHTADWSDLLATAGGGLVGVLILKVVA